MIQRFTVGIACSLLTVGSATAQPIEDDDLLKDRGRRSIETIESKTPVAVEADMLVRAPLIVPSFDPSLVVELVLPTGQTLMVSEGRLDVPAGTLTVRVRRTHPSGKTDSLEYPLIVPVGGTYLPLPRTVDLYVAGVHQKTWFQPHENSNPPTDVQLKAPGSMRSIPASMDGVLLPEGEVVRIDVPANLSVFEAHKQWSQSNAEMGSYHLLSGLGIAGGVGLAAVGISQMNVANTLKQEAEAIDDPSAGDEFSFLNDEYSKAQATSRILLGSGAALLGVGITVALGPASKKSKKTKRFKTEYEALTPVLLSRYASQTSLSPATKPIGPAARPTPTPAPPTPPAEPKNSGSVWQ
jgi:hypothetical protein